VSRAEVVAYLRQFESKAWVVLREGYGLAHLRADAVAGLTVAIVALPLAMALAIASGTTPEKGLHTAIVAGFLISAFGGSRVQIGGPTAAFIPVVFVVIERFGYGGLVLCTLLAGLMLIAAGLLRLGTLMKYMPQPVITGFTAGIAVSIFTSQVRDALGLRMDGVPADFLGRLVAYAAHIGSAQPTAIALTALGVATIVALRRWRPAWPGFLLALLACTLAALVLALPTETIASRFGALPSALPVFDFPHIPFERTRELLPSAFTIAFLAGVESLLSAVVADGMTGRRHRSNAELVAQGIANCGSALFGGLPATRAIARTATNIRAGARSPLAAVFHSFVVLAAVVFLAPWLGYLPMASLAALLLVVAWNMSDTKHFAHLLRVAPRSDVAVLLTCFTLTVVFDMVVAVTAGVMMAALLFMRRMAEVSGVQLVAEGHPALTEPLPRGVVLYDIAGPLFFGAAQKAMRALQAMEARHVRVVVLDVEHVPAIDATGIVALESLVARLNEAGIKVILVAIQRQPLRALARAGWRNRKGRLRIFRSLDRGLAVAEATVAGAAGPPRSTAGPLSAE